MAVSCFWYLSQNFGDALNVLLVRAITGDAPIYADRTAPGTKYIVCGSILSQATHGCIVWGAGVGSMEELVEPAAELRAVRGPLSRKRAVLSGATCPRVYGDPALLLPRFYSPGKIARARVALVPHYVDQAEAWERYGSEPSVRLVNVLEEPERVIDAIVSSEAVVATSLHGLVAAVAYGIPVCWAKITDGIYGDGSKYRDFFFSCGADPGEPLDLSSVKLDAEQLVAATRSVAIPDLDPLWAACPFR